MANRDLLRPLAYLAGVLVVGTCIFGMVWAENSPTFYDRFSGADERCGSGTTNLPRGYRVEYVVSKDVQVIVVNTTSTTMPVLEVHRRFKGKDRMLGVWTRPGRERHIGGGLGGQHYSRAEDRALEGLVGRELELHYQKDSDAGMAVLTWQYRCNYYPNTPTDYTTLVTGRRPF